MLFHFVAAIGVAIHGEDRVMHHFVRQRAQQRGQHAPDHKPLGCKLNEINIWLFFVG